MESLLNRLREFGFGRLAAMLGVSAGVAAVLIALMLRIGTEPKALLYSNLDLKEASQISQALDGAGIKYEAKGDGSTIMVDRDKVQPDATIESLDLKSIDIVMILTAIEEKFDVYIPMDGSFQDAKDVQGLIDAIAVHIQKEKEKENKANG